MQQNFGKRVCGLSAATLSLASASLVVPPARTFALTELAAEQRILNHEARRQIDQVEVWINAFIPKEIANYTVEIPATVPRFGGMTALPPPAPGVSGHFLTDQRGFDADPRARSRMHSRVLIDVRTGRFIGQPQSRVDPTMEIDIRTGQVLCDRGGSVDQLVPRVLSHRVMSNGRTVMEISFSGAASNPCFDRLAALVPNIDWDVRITLSVSPDGQRCLVESTGHVESFPAFEMYAAVPGGPVSSVFALPPERGKTPMNLFGPPDRSVRNSAWVHMPLEGSWQSADPGRRFRLNFDGRTPVLVERNSDGRELSTPVRVSFDGPQVRIERDNSDAVLQHLGFGDARLRRSIIRAGVQPSYLILERGADSVKAQWHGVVVMKRPDNSFDRLDQPGVRPPRSYEFNRIR